MTNGRQGARRGHDRLPKGARIAGAILHAVATAGNASGVPADGDQAARSLSSLGFGVGLASPVLDGNQMPAYAWPKLRPRDRTIVCWDLLFVLRRSSLHSPSLAISKRSEQRHLAAIVASLRLLSLAFASVSRDCTKKRVPVARHARVGARSERVSWRREFPRFCLAVCDLTEINPGRLPVCRDIVKPWIPRLTLATNRELSMRDRARDADALICCASPRLCSTEPL